MKHIHKIIIASTATAVLVGSQVATAKPGPTPSLDEQAKQKQQVTQSQTRTTLPDYDIKAPAMPRP